MASASDLFSPADVARARRYHRPLYVALVADLALGAAVLGALAFSRAGAWLYRPLDGLPWWAAALIYPAFVVMASTLVRLPLSAWRGHLRERRWGFSTQSARGWLLDRVKGLALGVLLTDAFVLVLVGLARAFPHAWPAVAAPAAAGLVLVLGFVAPVVVEPLFNRFRPLEDAGLAADLRSLAERAGVPVRDVLVCDASRRTRKVNAYVSGLGATRRVVVFDTLLSRDTPRELRLVVAHELGHRRERHVVKGTLIAMGGAAAAMLVYWALLSWPALLDAIGASGPGDPRVTPFVLLVGTALELAGLPFQTALSRHWERAADRFSLELTGDLEAFEGAQRGLAVSNLSDLDPPRAVYLLLFTHPTAPERIAEARKWAAAGTVA